MIEIFISLIGGAGMEIVLEDSWEALKNLLDLGIFVIYSGLEVKEGVENVNLCKIDFDIIVHDC